MAERLIVIAVGAGAYGLGLGSPAWPSPGMPPPAALQASPGQEAAGRSNA